ncbi:MAG: hypothetical protein ACKV19_08680 [Verrucomicrobiales bacterium]
MSASSRDLRMSDDGISGQHRSGAGPVAHRTQFARLYSNCLLFVMKYFLIRSFSSLTLVGLLAAKPVTSFAAILYATGFEDPPLANGSVLLGQDGWSTAIPPFLNPNAAVITDAVARSGSQSLQVAGADLVAAPQVDPLAVVGSYRRPVNYDASSGLSRVLITSDVRLDGPVLGTGDFFGANIAARSGSGGVGEISISSDGKVYGYTGNFGSPVLASTSITLGEWHTLGIDVDFAADTYTFLLNGSSLGTFPFEVGFSSDLLLRGSAVAFGFPDEAAPDSQYKKSNFVARFDNFSIATVPETNTTFFLLAGALGCLAWPRTSGTRARGERGRTVAS